MSGLASVFPAIFLTTMVALWFSQDSSVSIGAAGPMMLGGASGCSFFFVSDNYISSPRVSTWVDHFLVFVYLILVHTGILFP